MISCARSACLPLTSARLGVAAGSRRGALISLRQRVEFLLLKARSPLKPFVTAHATVFHSFNCTVASPCSPFSVGPIVGRNTWIKFVFSTAGSRQHLGDLARGDPSAALWSSKRPRHSGTKDTDAALDVQFSCIFRRASVQAFEHPVQQTDHVGGFS
jgi:hypothetical protein